MSGEHFPEDDPAIAGISGAVLLARTLEIVRTGGFTAAFLRCDRHLRPTGDRTAP